MYDGRYLKVRVLYENIPQLKDPLYRDPRTVPEDGFTKEQEEYNQDEDDYYTQVLSVQDVLPSK
jgi:hypothetical protein